MSSKIRVSSTLTIYHDGQFWVGMFERVEDAQLFACRIVFGAEPSNEEIQQLICENWNDLQFTRPITCPEEPKIASNPKRRQREAAREMKKRGPSTKAQRALSEEREAAGLARKAEVKEKRADEKRKQFEQCQEKRKQKHRGK